MSEEIKYRGYIGNDQQIIREIAEAGTPYYFSEAADARRLYLMFEYYALPNEKLYIFTFNGEDMNPEVNWKRVIGTGEQINKHNFRLNESDYHNNLPEIDLSKLEPGTTVVYIANEPVTTSPDATTSADES